jgi:hypothetical protein
MRSELLAALAALTACAEHGQTPAACTPDGQGISGANLFVESFDTFDGQPCDYEILSSQAAFDARFGGFPPVSLPPIDFAVDRVLLSSSNPIVRFAVDDGSAVVVAEEELCQGIAPSCVVHVLRGTVRSTVDVLTCPYRGPDPCLAP